MPGLDGIHEYLFKKFTSIHDRLAIKMNRCLQETEIPEWITKGKTALIQKGITPHFQQLQIHDVTTDDVKDINSTNKGGNIRFTNKLITVLQGTERIPQAGHLTMVWMVWIDKNKGIWYGPLKLDNKLSKNVQYIQWSHKVYQKYHGKLESQTDGRRKKFNRGKNSEKDLPE